MDSQCDTKICSPLQAQLFSLQGHTALVTGAGSGLGKYMAHALLHAGANLILVGRTADRIEASAEEIFLSLEQRRGLSHDSDPAKHPPQRNPEQDKRIACIPFDVSELKALPELAEKASRPFGTPDILVNAAGLNPRKPWDELTPDIWEYTLRLNLSAPFFLAQALVPGMMRKGWGRIINIASLQSNRAFPNGLPYGASKGGIAQLTRGMAEAWSRPGTGITANAIAPGFFKTQLTAPLFDKPDVVEALARQTTMKRVGGADDIQGLTMFLASPASAYITGQVIHIDGGWSAI